MHKEELHKLHSDQQAASIYEKPIKLANYLVPLGQHFDLLTNMYKFATISLENFMVN